MRVDMETMLDPGFIYPDLVATAEAMVTGTISPKAGSLLARRVTGGEVRQTSVGRALVIGPQEGMVHAMARLQAYANAHDQRTPSRWAAFVLMVQVQLGSGDCHPDAAPVALANALRLLDTCLQATGTRCPKTAVKFATQAVDSVLESPACTDTDLRARLKSAKARFQACGSLWNRLGSYFRIALISLISLSLR